MVLFDWTFFLQLGKNYYSQPLEISTDSFKYKIFKDILSYGKAKKREN